MVFYLDLYGQKYISLFKLFINNNSNHWNKYEVLLDKIKKSTLKKTSLTLEAFIKNLFNLAGSTDNMGLYGSFEVLSIVPSEWTTKKDRIYLGKTLKFDITKSSYISYFRSNFVHKRTNFTP